MPKGRFSLTRVVLGAVTVVVVLILACWVRLQLAIDSCLDRGGRWDYDQGVCVDARPYAEQPSRPVE